MARLARPRKSRARNVSRDGPNPVDIHVGTKVRQRRTLLGMSQEKLGTAVGLTFQQIQKYERGTNRIGASRLHEFSHILDVPVSYFFDELPPRGQGRQGRGFSEGVQTSYEHDAFSKRETLELVRAYYRITDAPVRKRIVDLIRSVGKAL